MRNGRNSAAISSTSEAASRLLPFHKDLLFSMDLPQQFYWIGLLHLDIGEEFLASIFQGGSKEIYRIVDNEETVMIMTADVYIDRGGLLVVAQNIQLLLL